MNFLRNTGKSADYIVTGTWSKKARTKPRPRARCSGLGRQGGQLQPRAPAGRAEARPRRRLRLHGLQRDHPGRAVPRASRTWAACRWSATPRPISSPGRCRSIATASSSPAPEERRPGGRDDRDHPRRPGPAVARRPALDAQLPGAGREQVALEHPADVRHLHGQAGDRLAAQRGRRAGEDGRLNRRKAAAALRGDRRVGRFLSGPRRAGQPFDDERPLPPGRPALEEPFLKEAEARGLVELKGHRSVGGCRASIYNAMPIEGVVALRDFMVEFCKKHGGK